MDFNNRRPLFAMVLAISLLAMAAVSCTEDTPTATPTATSQAPTATPTVGPAPTTTAPLGEGQALITSLHHDDLGDILVDNEGMVIYIFTQDEPGVSNCSGGCAATWPPVPTVGEPAQEITSAELGTIERGDGTTQVTVNGLPVYYYVGDDERGEATGQGLGDQWYVLDLDGEPVMTEPDDVNGDGVSADIEGFTLPNLQITAGTTVTWTNRDSTPHNVTHSDGDLFGSSSLSQGDTFSFTFEDAGRYDYLCTIHPTMTGVIVVSAGGPDTSTPTATPTPMSEPATPTPTPASEDPTATPSPTPDDGLGEQYSAEIESFVHPVIEVTVGTTVTWTNLDNAGHTVTSGTIAGGNNGGPLNSGTMLRNDTYSFTFTEPGEYQYYCVFPHNMQGKVTVVAAE